MKTIRYFFFLLIVVSLAYGADSIITLFKANSDGKAITLKWSSSDESGIISYGIHRSASGQVFKNINIIKANGFPSNYEFTDNDALKANQINDKIQSPSVYSYRLEVIKKDGNNFSTDQIYVTHNVNNIRRTWGMIKEMFR
ncbi:MAG: hypothetical protein HW421_1473 [Ignavibacteria bacterium]|nr:hypothetical protein [Ignavibacteria bacterium]